HVPIRATGYLPPALPARHPFEAALELRGMARERATDARSIDSWRPLALPDRSLHPAQQVEIVLIAIRLEVELGGHFAAPLVPDPFDVALHESVIVAPTDTGGANGGLLGARGDLMRVQVVKPELIDKRLFDFLVQDQVAVGVDCAASITHCLRHVPIDVDG